MNIYIGLFLTAFSALALEVTLSRLLSVVTWYHLAFFAISSAMLGMTAGATKVYLTPHRYGEKGLDRTVARTAIRYALSIPVALVLLCMLPLELQRTVMSPLAFLVATAVCAIPFFYAGIVVSVVITKYDLPMGRLYASDLIGAALGCLLVLGGLEIFDAPSLILLCAAFAILAAMSYACKEPSAGLRRGLALLFAIFVILPFANAFSLRGIRPLIIKGKVVSVEEYLIEKWNSFSRIIVYKGELGAPAYWGPSPVAPFDKTYHYRMNIDGEAGTVMWRFRDDQDLEPLKYDVTNVGYYLDRPGKVCVIGVGAGRDVQSAILFGHNDVVGLEVNPIFIDLLKGIFKDFARLAGRDGVELIVDDARAYLSRTKEEFTIIQMSLIDTWAATGAGAFSLTENALYTVEAWKVFLERLTDDGFFTVSRWHNPNNIGETGRVVSLAIASLLELEIEDPQEHLALITTDRISTLLISKNPFGEDDIATLREVCDKLHYHAAFLPGQDAEDPRIAMLLGAKSSDSLRSIAARSEFNYEPPTDEKPYFFNMLRLRNIGSALEYRAGVIRGNLTATFTLFTLLVCLTVIALLTIVVPLVLRPRLRLSQTVAKGAFLSGAAYFSLIGAAFMFLEIAMIQRLSVFLGHPVYALGILLFTLILSTGIGSLLSDRLPLRKQPGIIILPLLTAGAAIGMRVLLTVLLKTMITAPVMHKMAAAILMVFPLGILMGCFFPTGMTLAKAGDAGDTPWFWALNGIFGTLCSVLAVFLSIYIGISTNFYVAAGCYALSGVFLSGLGRAEATE